MSCPDDAVLALLVEGKLLPERRQQLDDHLDSCPSCQALIVALVRGQPTEQAPTSDATAPTLASPRHPTPGARGSASLTAPELVLGQRGPIDADTCLTREQPDRYQHVEVLGIGGIGKVSLALDRHLGRHIAVKELLPHQLEGATINTTQALQEASPRGDSRTPAETRFLSEARITGSLEHPGIVPVHELGVRSDSTLYYTMKRVRGSTLKKALRGRDLAGRLELLPNFLDLCHAVGYAHANGVIHRDLKPDNVMLGEYGETIVLDWGLAKVKRERDVQSRALADLLEQLRASDPSQTVKGMPLGTPAYMPPEQAAGELERIDERSDVYSLGAVLYQILTGRPPFVGDSSAAVMAQVLAAAPIASPAELEPAIPDELSAIALRALEHEPSRRYKDAEALAGDVLAYQTGQLVRAHTYGLWSLLRRWLSRHRRAIAAACVAVLVAAGAWWYRGHQDAAARQAAERARRARVLQDVERILTKAQESAEPDWLDASTYRLIALKEPAVEQRLIRALGRRWLGVRRLAARSLGGMKSERAIAALIGRLGEGVERSPEVVVEVINALGLVGHWRAEEAVAAARWRAGQWGYIWTNTELAYSMIPLPPAGAMGAPTAKKWHLRGRALFFKQDVPGALAAYGRAIALNSRYIPSINNRSVVRKVLGDYRAALVDLDRLLTLKPTVIQARSNRAMIRRLLGDYDGARADLEVALKQNSRHSFALLESARLRTTLGDTVGALADYQRLIKANPKNPSHVYFLGGFWFEQRRWAEALGAYSKALALNPRFVDAFVGRAEVYQVTGRPDDALADLDRALVLKPRHGEARAVRARLRALSGDLDAAKDDLDRSVQLRPAEGLRWAQRGVIYHLQAGKTVKGLQDLRNGLRRAKQSHRVLLLSCALAVAEHAGQRSAREELLTALGREKETRRYQGLVVKLLLGRLKPGQLEPLKREAARGSGRRCLYQLAQGVRAALGGRSAAARSAYALAREDASPNDLACLTAAAVTRGRRGR